MNLFDEGKEAKIKTLPLAYRMRPVSLEEYAGQKHILSEGKLLWRAIKADRISSLMLYGPAGTGKTTLAFVISRHTKAHFESINASGCGVEILRKIIQASIQRKKVNLQKTILFIDEIHRFNKSQQDVLMPAVEDGSLILIGATTYNPFHSLIPPLVSRSLIFELKKLSKDDIVTLLRRALTDKERGLADLPLEISGEALDVIAVLCDGDARKALTALEIACLTAQKNKEGKVVIDKETALDSIQKKIISYERMGEGHYDAISAFIKSLRGSDPDAAVYWLAKMLYAGEEPLFIARRMVVFASEDIGNADPQALVLACACYQAVENIGLPEAKIILAQGACYLASASKSNASYIAISEAGEDVEKERTQEIPDYLKNASYAEEHKLGRGGYINPHFKPEEKQVYLKENKKYYRPKT